MLSEARIALEVQLEQYVELVQREQVDGQDSQRFVVEFGYSWAGHVAEQFLVEFSPNFPAGHLTASTHNMVVSSL